MISQCDNQRITDCRNCQRGAFLILKDQRGWLFPEEKIVCEKSAFFRKFLFRLCFRKVNKVFIVFVYFTKSYFKKIKNGVQ